MKKHKLLLPLVGIAATAACMTPMFALTSCHKPQQKTGSKNIPFDTNFFEIDYSKTGKYASIKGFSAKVIKNPDLLKNYDTLNFTNYKDSTHVDTGLRTFKASTIMKKYIKKFICSNDDKCVINFSDASFESNYLQEIDFGENEVNVYDTAFGVYNSDPTLLKVTLSPKTSLISRCASDCGSPFLNQTTLATIDVSRFTTATQITDVTWRGSGSANIWVSGTHATKGKIIISKKGLQSAWKEKFEQAGWPTTDWDNWKFEVAK